MTFLFYALLFCIAAVFVYMARFSGRLRISVTRSIDAPVAEVYARVVDFNTWGEWSPWLEHDPDARVTLSAVPDREGSRYEWAGERYGAMAFAHTRLLLNQQIDQRVRSLSPFRYHGRGCWLFRELNGRTEVTWSFKGRVGFTLRPFTPTVQSAIALDYRYGLNKLACLLESPESDTASQRYVLEYVGEREVSAGQYVFSTYSGPLKDIEEAKQVRFRELEEALASRGIEPIGHPLAVYVKTNIKLRTTTCHVGLMIGSAEVDEMAVRDLPAHRAYVVRLHGSRSALEVAWYEAMQRLRLEQLRPDQRFAPFECYLSAPDVPEQEQVTELHIPLR